VFIGTKMLLIDIYKIPVAVSLGVVFTILAITMIWSSKTAPNTLSSVRYQAVDFLLHGEHQLAVELQLDVALPQARAQALGHRTE